MEGLWIDDLYSFSHALQAIRNGDENVLNASGLQPLKKVTRTVCSHPNPEMNGHVLYSCATADFDSEGVKESDRIHTCERAILPLLDVFKHPVGNLADVVGADVHTVEIVDEAWMSRVLMPLAYMAMICSSILPNDRLCLGTMIGSKVFLRSRRTLSGRGPYSVLRVL